MPSPDGFHDGFVHVSPWKLYTNGALLDQMTPGTRLQVAWDDFEFGCAAATTTTTRAGGGVPVPVVAGAVGCVLVFAAVLFFMRRRCRRAPSQTSIDGAAAGSHIEFRRPEAIRPEP